MLTTRPPKSQNDKIGEKLNDKIGEKLIEKMQKEYATF
jgi:hypothetical protein